MDKYGIFQCMIKGITNVLIWSENYRKLADWYIEKLGFETIEEFKHPNDTGVLMRVGYVGLWIGQHSKVKGKNKDIHRFMIDFSVDSVSKSYELLKSKNVKFYCPPFREPTSDNYVATFYDADDNLIQIIGQK